MAATGTRRGDRRAGRRKAAKDGRGGDTEGDEGSGDAREVMRRAAKNGRSGDREGGKGQRGQEGGHVRPRRGHGGREEAAGTQREGTRRDLISKGRNRGIAAFELDMGS